MKALRVGVIGAGSMGSAHASAISMNPVADLVTICDTDLVRATDVADRYGAGGAVADVAGLLATDVDAVVVATPESHHLEPTLACLDAGKHVLVEKPLTTDIAQAHRIAEAAARSGTLVLPGFNLRYDPRHRELRDWLGSDHAGPLVSLALRRNRPAALFDTYQRVHPGYESTSHDIDLALWLTGRRVRSVYASHRQRPGERNPFALWSILELDDGTVVTTEALWSVPTDSGIAKADLVEAVCQSGTAHLDVARQSTTFWDDRGVTELSRPLSTTVSSPFVSIDAEIADFVACATAHRPSEWASLDDAVHVVEVVDTMIRSARSGQPIRIGGR